jgi:amidase
MCIAETTTVQVRGLRRRGAVILAKANMGEFAWSPFESRGSLFGVVRNPYDTSRTVAGAYLSRHLSISAT